MKYLVTSPSGREITIDAKNSTQAKRIACKVWGILPGDTWCGISVLKANWLKVMITTIHTKGSLNGSL